MDWGNFMNFTYNSYENLIDKLVENLYHFTDYDHYLDYEKSCILRHDIDFDLNKALVLAEIEEKLNNKYKDHKIYATYFILLSSDFYNIFSKENIQKIKEIQKLGGQIGLHFDEKKYIDHTESPDVELIKEKVLQEKNILSNIIEDEIMVVSMHRPSKWFLNSNIKFNDIINVYSTDFFNRFKYISDSRRYWKENIQDVIQAQCFDRLHILTHPFWYNNEEISLRESIYNFLFNSKYKYWDIMNENITKLSDIIEKDCL